MGASFFSRFNLHLGLNMKTKWKMNLWFECHHMLKAFLKREHQLRFLVITNSDKWEMFHKHTFSSLFVKYFTMQKSCDYTMYWNSTKISPWFWFDTKWSVHLICCMYSNFESILKYVLLDIYLHTFRVLHAHASNGWK